MLLKVPALLLFLATGTFRVSCGDDGLTGSNKATSSPRAPQHTSTESDPKAQQIGHVQSDAISRITTDIQNFGSTKAGLAAAKLAYTSAKLLFGDESPQGILAMTGLGFSYAQQGDFPAAEPLLERAVAISRKLYPPGKPIAGHRCLAVALEVSGLVRKLQGNYAQAEPLFRESLELRQRLLGENNIETASSVDNLAGAYQSMKDYARAEPLFRKALAIKRHALGENHPQTVRSLNNLAGLYRSMGDYAKADQLLQESRALRKKILAENRPATPAELNRLALQYRSLGEFAKAESLYKQVLELRKKTLGEQHLDTAESLNNLAELYRFMGEHAKAESHYRQVIAIRTKLLGEQHADTATSLYNLAFWYGSIGAPAKAEPLYWQALKIREKVLGETHPDTITTINNLAFLYNTNRQYAKAKPLYLRALDINKRVLGPEHPDTARSISSLARLYQSMGQGQNLKAESFYRQALEIKQNVLGDKGPNTAADLDGLASLYCSMGQYAKAEPLFWQSLEIQRAIWGESSMATALSYNNLLALCLATGDFARAEPVARQALEASQRYLIDIFVTLSEREQLAFEANLRSNLDLFLSLSVTPEYSAVADPKFVSNANVYRYVLLGKGTVTAQQSFIHLKLRRPELAPVFEELALDSRRLQKLRFSPPAEPKRREVWQSEIDRLEKQRTADQQKLAAQSGEFRMLEEAMRADPEQVQKLQAALPPKSALVDVLEYTHLRRSPIKTGWLIRERRLVAFVVRKDRPIERIELGPVAPLGAAADRWLQAIARGFGGVNDSSSEPRGAVDSQKPPQEILREGLIAPLRAHLDGIELVLLSPDGFLNQIPLVALPGRANGTYLLEEINLAVVPVSRQLSTILQPSLESGSSVDPSLLLVGDVDFGTDPGLASVAKNDVTQGVPLHRSAARGPGGCIFAPLPGTAQEVQGIAQAFRANFGDRRLQILKKSHATEDAFRNEAPRHRWIHLATHGFFAPKSVLSLLDPVPQPRLGEGVGVPQVRQGFDPGLLSGIAFAGANDGVNPAPVRGRNADTEVDDGILTALEVAELDLRTVDLAVLSACETGLGRVAGGEGVLGLQRAFQTAGARTCLTSLWKVDDTATQVLMTEFYTNLWQRKLGKLESLRQAQLTMLRRYDPREKVLRGLDLTAPDTNDYRHGSPLFWAAFVLSGDWR
jgi:CHAT domain-containing protein